MGLGDVPRVSRRDRDDAAPLDVATQVPHGAVRGYVMGERGARNEPATAEDIAAMAAIVRAGMQAGALGFSTSRTTLHTASTASRCPARSPRGRAVRHRPRPRRARHRDLRAGPGRFMARTCSRRPARSPGCGNCRPRPAGRSASASPSTTSLPRPGAKARCRRGQRRRLRLRAQVSGRPLACSSAGRRFHPFVSRATY